MLSLFETQSYFAKSYDLGAQIKTKKTLLVGLYLVNKLLAGKEGPPNREGGGAGAEGFTR